MPLNINHIILLYNDIISLAVLRAEYFSSTSFRPLRPIVSKSSEVNEQETKLQDLLTSITKVIFESSYELALYSISCMQLFVLIVQC